MNIPVLLITFNRPVHTRRVLEAVLKQHPSELYVFQDGARDGNANDAEPCRKVRETVLELASDAGVAVHTYFSDRNLGCGAGPMSGISWFFSQADCGIVMEDDCLPHPDFFGYCSDLLNRYRDDERVMYISSTLYDDRWKCEDSYDFSHYMITGAWASWARAWKGFDFDLKDFDAKKFRRHLKSILYNTIEADWWYFKALEIQRDEEKKSYWDYQMQIHLFNHDGLTIHPSRNMISNIGFDEAGTHTLNNSDGKGNKPVFPILPITHPTEVNVDIERDYRCFAKQHSSGWYKDRIQFLYKCMLFNHGVWHGLLMVYKKLKH